MSLKPYPAYKDSGVEWLGEVPAHWEVVQSRRYFSERKERARPSDKQLTASQKYGILPQAEFMEREDQRVMQVLTGIDILKHVEPNDFVISMRSFQGGLEWSNVSGSISSAYVMIEPSVGISSSFFYYLFKSSIYIQALQATTNLVRDGQALRFANFVQLDLPLMPEAEQVAIAAFLDRETAKIDALVAEQERLIGLLAEKRRAVVSHAVTKGLDPNALMKDSGIAWLGEVPAHWLVTKIGKHLEILSGYAFPSAGFSEDESDMRLLRGVNVGIQEIRWTEVVYWERRPDDGLDRFLLAPGQLVMGMDRPWVGSGARVAVLTEEDAPCLLLQRVTALTPQPELSRDLAFAIFQSRDFEDYFTPDMTGVSVPHISPEQIRSFPFALPPLEEQQQITAYLGEVFADLDALTAEVTRAVALLKERRAALISAAVTGKIDVRGSVEEAT